MKIVCDCGNEFTFEMHENEENEIDGFEFISTTSDDGEECLNIHCLKCDEILVLE